MSVRDQTRHKKALKLQAQAKLHTVLYWQSAAQRMSPRCPHTELVTWSFLLALTSILVWIQGPMTLAWLANCRRRRSLFCCRACSSIRAWSRWGTSCLTCSRRRVTENQSAFIHLNVILMKTETASFKNMTPWSKISKENLSNWRFLFELWGCNISKRMWNTWGKYKSTTSLRNRYVRDLPRLKSVHFPALYVQLPCPIWR